mgnify:CR=1 FL=1
MYAIEGEERLVNGPATVQSSSMLVHLEESDRGVLFNLLGKSIGLGSLLN